MVISTNQSFLNSTTIKHLKLIIIISSLKNIIYFIYSFAISILQHKIRKNQSHVFISFSQAIIQYYQIHPSVRTLQIRSKIRAIAFQVHLIFPIISLNISIYTDYQYFIMDLSIYSKKRKNIICILYFWVISYRIILKK